ncbi:uncharacterized protein LOC126682193 [Mercurialis annua]|uniref:uncharacterized protein LOC126682193 n=1 Tax=Mercurialis annua TaxID=3986 RepID=UPI00215F77CB|nr:uncharacterized protein LOC126682193 [Mercurialis annua]
METWKARFANGMKRKLRKSQHVVAPGEGTSTNDTNAGAVVVDGDGNDEETEKNKNPSVGGPPVDDVCPICFGSFTIPCKSICGHWYCGSCILQYWNYAAASKPCKCPMCASSITKLIPEEALYSQEDREVARVLENVHRYNRLFVGGALGLVQKVRESPLFVKRIFHQMMDPDRPDSYLHEMRLFAMMLSILYAATPFNFIPTGGLGIVRLFDYIAIALVLVLRLVGIFRRRRLAQRIRHLAAAQPIGELALED